MRRSQQVTIVTLEAIEGFRSWLCDRGRSEHTAKAYSTDLRMFLKATGEDFVTREEFEDLAAAWLTRDKRRVSVKTTCRRLTSVRAFAKWAGWGPILDEYILPKGTRPMPHPLPEGVEGVRKLISIAKRDEHKALIALCGLAGCRISEARSIDPASFELSKMLLTIRGKGDKTRVVPISPEAWEVLEKNVIRAFVNRTNLVTLTDRAARNVITTLGERAGLKRHISSHDLRATFGTEVYYKTGDIRLVQELLGHANVTQTEVYIGVAGNKLREAVEL